MLLFLLRVKMKFNYIKAIEKLNGTLYYEDKQYVFATFKGYRFKVYKRHLRQNTFSFDGNFRACEDSVEYFKHYMREHCKHSNLLFNNSVFKGMREHVFVECKEHGSFRTSPELLINRNSGCVKCYNKYEKPKVKNKGIDKFVDEANLRFDSKFDYSETVYKNTMTKVKIICPEHGAFFQTPNEHLQSTHACPACYSVYNSFKLEDYEKLCPKGSHLYVVRLHNEIEQFYKIGISKTPAKRFKQYKQDGFNIGDNIILFNQDAGLIFCLEDDLLNSYKSEKYIPTKKFKGYTECFTYVDIAEVQEMFYTLVKCKREIEELS